MRIDNIMSNSDMQWNQMVKPYKELTYYSLSDAGSATAEWMLTGALGPMDTLTSRVNARSNGTGGAG